MTHIEFEIPDDLHAEAAEVAGEMGLSVGDIARSALEGYLDGVRAPRREDFDEPDDAHESMASVAQLPRSFADQSIQLEGTEPWLSTEHRPRGE